MNSELAKFVSDPRYADLTPEQRWDAFGKLEPRFGALKDDAERDKFIGMVEGRFRQPVGSEKTGLPGPALVGGARMEEVDAPSLPGAIADVTLGGAGRGVIHTVEGAGGAMRALGAEKVGKAVSDFGSKYGQMPSWLQDISQRPDHLYDPLFITNLASEGVGSSLSFFLPGAAAGRAVGVVSKLPLGALRTAAQWAAGSATGATLESLVDAGSAYNEAIEKHGAKPEVAAQVFSETLKREIPVTMLTNALGEMAPRVGGSLWKKALQVGWDTIVNGVEGVAQGVAQRSAANKVLGTKTPLLEGAPEEFLGEALGGGIISGGRALIGGEGGHGRQESEPYVPVDDETRGLPPGGGALPGGGPAGRPGPGGPPRGYVEEPARNPEVLQPEPETQPHAERPPRDDYERWRQESFRRTKEGLWERRESPGAMFTDERLREEYEKSAVIDVEPERRQLPAGGESAGEPEVEKGRAREIVGRGEPGLLEEGGAGENLPAIRGSRGQARQNPTPGSAQGPFDMPGKKAPASITDAVKDLQPGEGNYVSIAKLRERFPHLDKRRFDEEVIRLADEGKLVLSEDDRPDSPERAMDQVHDAEGRRYVAVALESKPKLHIPSEQHSIVARVMTHLNYGGHSAEPGPVIPLEKIAEGVYGGKRTEGRFTKRQIYEAQEAGMNAWMRDNSQQVMRMDPHKAIAVLRAKTKMLATQSVRDDEQVRKQQFSTPPALAYLAQKVAGVTKDDSVLEPSGGTGGLVSLVLPVAKSVHLNEIDAERAALARQVGFENQSAHDGELINALLPADVKPSVVLMNPPFSSGALKNGGQGAERNRTLFGYNHVESALQRLAPGGRLVAILSGGMEGRDQGARLTAPQAAKFWQRMSKQYNIRANVGIPGKEYSKYGTTFPTRLVVIDKTGPTPGSNWLAQVAQAVKGDFDSIEGAWDALAGVAADRGAVAEDASAVGGRKPATGMAPDSGGIQPSGGKQPGDAGKHRPPKRTRPGQRSTGSDEKVQRGDDSQPDGAGESRTEPSETEQDRSGGDHEGAPEQPDQLTAAAGLTPEQLIAQVTQNIAGKRGGKTPNKLQQKAAAAKQKAAERKAKLTKQPAPKPENPLKAQADAARDRLRAKMRGTTLQSGIDPQDLVDVATIGAEKILDGATKFADWAKSMREDVGDLLDWMARTTKQAADAVLRTIHRYARTVASNFGVEAEETPAAPEEDIAVKRRGKTTAKEDAGAFVIYEPTLEGNPHPGDIVESKSMATVSLPPLTYEPKLPADVKISNVQLESVVIAGQQNERRNGDGSRGAALIGDGTGVGKGRTVAAMLLDNWNHGRKRLMWISEKWDLIEDAKRDLEGIGAQDLAEKAVGLNKLDNKGTIGLSEGVIFTTYDLLRSKDKKGNTTLATVEQWLKGKDEADGAFVAFDEAHEMKNTVPAGRANASQMGIAAKKLRDSLPNLRMVFMSATSATEVENMGYLERLGLWGPKTPFPNGFAQFVNEVGSGGIATMELIARELKATGKYIARTLSYKGVKYDEVRAELNPDQREIYRNAASAWRKVTGLVEGALDTVNGGREARAQFMSQYWSANQRFFNLLLTALKTPAAIDLAERGLADGKAIVITLQNTNEAAQNRQEAKLKGEEDEDGDDLDFGPKDILLNLVQEHYPVQQWVDEVYTDGEGKERIKKVPLTRKDPETGKDVPVLNPTAIAERDALIAKLDKELHMPANPLDILIEHFGRDKVAELTGRSKYYDAATGRFEKRGGELPRKKVNIAESQAFQDGSKLVAILSQAAGTGISLHASNDAQNQRQRWHITLQAGWSADKAMQMLGRTHRTNQKHTPHYYTLVSDMSGEKRFLATIAKRMNSLGALTRGSAEASGGADLSNVNYESSQGQQAATTFVQRLEGGQKVPGVKLDGFAVLQEMGLTKKIVQNGIEREVVAENAADVRRILNRLLALDPDIQSKVFEYYHSIFEAAVQKAMEDGTLDTGVKELQGDSIAIEEQRVLSADPDTGAETHYYRVKVASKLPVATPEDLDRQMKKHPDGTFYVNKRDMKIAFTVDAEPIVSPDGKVREAVRGIRPSSRIWQKHDKPAGGAHAQVLDLDTYLAEEVEKAEKDVAGIERNYDWATRNYGAESMYTRRYGDELETAKKKLAEAKARAEAPLEYARELWADQYETTPKTQDDEYHLIGGAVLRWWNTVKQNQGIRLARDSRTGERVVGAVIDPARINDVLARIAGGRVQVSGSQVATDVLRNGTEYQLERGVRIRRGRVSRDQVVQIMVPDPKTGRILQDLGVVYERGVTPVYYVPTKDQASILDRVLAQFPVETNGGSPLHALGSFTPKSIDRSLTSELLAKDAEVNLHPAREGRPAFVYTNQHAYEIIRRVFPGADYLASTMEPDDVRKLLTELERTRRRAKDLRAKVALNKLSKAISDAAKQSAGYVLHFWEAPMDRGRLRSAYMEEMHHFLWLQLGRGTRDPYAAGIPEWRFTQDPLARKVLGWLKARYALDDERAAVTELAAQIGQMGFARSRFGLDREQTLTVASLVDRLVREVHGDAPADRLLSFWEREVREGVRNSSNLRTELHAPHSTGKEDDGGRDGGVVSKPDQEHGDGGDGRGGGAGPILAGWDGERGYARADLFGAHLIARGLKRFSEWLKAMVERFGPAIKRRGLSIYARAKKIAVDLARDEEGTVHLEDVKELGIRAARMVRDFYDVALTPMGERIKDANARLWEQFQHARDVGDVMAGGFLNRLLDARMNKLTREELFMLLDVHEGRMKRAPQKVVDAYRVIRSLMDDVVAIAQGLDVRVRGSEERRAFVPRGNFFPHVMRSSEALKSGPVRRDVIENLTRQGYASPEAFLDHYIEYLDSGKPHRSLIDHLVKTGQAADVADALAKLRRFRNNTKRHGSLEYAREIDLPFYDPNPARVLPWHFATAGERLAQIAEFGQDDQEIKQRLVEIAEAGESDEQVRRWLDRIFKGIEEGNTREERVSRFLRAIQTMKLGLSFIPNATQAVLNVTPASDFRALWAGYKALFREKGRRFAVESGASIDPVLAEAHQSLGEGRMGRIAERFLTPFQLAERHNRIVAANAGADFAARLWKVAQQSTRKGRWARRRLADLGVDWSRPLSKGELLMAAKKFSDLTQFRSRPENLPAWASRPLGKVMAQFKTFSYQQARFVVDQTVGELRRGVPLRAGRNLALFLVLGAGLGEFARLARALLTWGWDRYEKDNADIVKRVLNDIASVGAVGIMLDAAQAMERGKEHEWIAGPAADMGVSALRLGWTWVNPDKDFDEKLKATRKFYYRHGPFGSVARGVFEGN